MQPEDAESLAASPPGAATPSLARRLGRFDVTMLVMGSVIGSGIFVVPHVVARLVHSPALILGAWLLGGMVALAGSLVYAELTRRRPHVGGQYAFLREAYHPALAFLYGWSLLWVVQSGGMASVAVVFARYFLELLRLLGGWLVLHGQHDILGRFLSACADAPAAGGVVTTAAIGILTLINCTGVRAAGTTQNIFMALKIAAILMLVVCGLLLVHGPAPATPGFAEVARAGARSTALPGDLQLVAAFAAAMVPVFFAYGGWHTTTFIAGEVSEPTRTLPQALVLGVSGVIVLYVAVNFVCLNALGADRLAVTEHPASDVMRLALGDLGAALISVGIAISALGFLSQATLTSPRVYFAMAGDGLFFKSVAWVHPRTRVPVVAILLQGLFAIVIAVSGTFQQIVNYIMSVEMVFWSLTALSLFRIRRRDAELGNLADASMPGHPLTTLLFVGVNLAVLAGLFYSSFDSFKNSAMGLAIALLGLPVYWLWRLRKPAR
ncbi:MAG TPA: amino acid permease [Gemmataceae bacterium]|nr:amino acid permease [Gemmataceae bacterium]